MKQLIIIAVIALGLMQLFRSHNATEALIEETASDEPNLSSLSKADGTPRNPVWIVESAGNRIYLLGSIHVLRDEDYPLPDVFQLAYDDAEHLVMELDFTDLDPLATFATTRRLAMLPESESLRSVMGEKDYERALVAAKHAKIDLEQFARVDPWYAAMTITQVQLGRLGFKAENGIELYFANMAKRDNKDGSGLETIDEQLSILDELPAESQNRFLLESLVETEELSVEGERMIEAWKSGDADRLHRLFADDLESNPELHKALLVDRNLAWIPRILELTEETDDYLIIVGALHLVGDHGIVRLLRQRGVTVRQL